MRMAALTSRAVRFALVVTWLAFLVDTIFLAPSTLPSPLDLAWRLTLFDWPEPALISLWYCTGVVLFLHPTFTMAESPQSRPRGSTLLLPGVLFGSLLLLPYYAFRRVAPDHAPWRWPWRLLRGILLVELLGFAAYGIIGGNFAALWREVTERRFSHFLFLDFLLLSALLVALARGKLVPRA